LRPGEYHLAMPIQLRNAIEIKGSYPDKTTTFIIGGSISGGSGAGTNSSEIKEGMIQVIGKDIGNSNSNSSSINDKASLIDAIKLSHLTLSNTHAPCITVSQGHAIIDNCSLTSLEGSAALLVNKNAKCTINKCTLSHNGHAAILVQDNATIIIRDCDIAHNQVGIVIQDNAFCNLEQSRLARNKEHALAVESKLVPHVKSNKFSNNTIGPVRLKEGCSVELTSNELE